MTSLRRRQHDTASETCRIIGGFTMLRRRTDRAVALSGRLADLLDAEPLPPPKRAEAWVKAWLIVLEEIRKAVDDPAERPGSATDTVV